MAIDTIAQRLRDLDIFHGLAPQQVERIAREAERIIFRDSQVIAERGAQADGAYVLIAGRASASADPASAIPIQDVETGSMIAETAMLTEHEYSLTFRAEGEVRAIKITREMLRGQMLEDPALADHFIGRIAARLTRVALELRLIDERLTIASSGHCSDVTGQGPPASAAPESATA